ncbi:MAG: EamA/RhaT family transporter [Beijerinckiaceae bacterium]|nr:EamA/RhaT family transporter [Beijerinckiaceae bacterium]
MLAFLWIPTTLIAAAAQTARNATQAGLIKTIGTIGATQVRFLYGFPFSLVFLALVAAISGEAVPRPDGDFLLFTLAGAVSQIAATALMLAAMKDRSFSVTTAYVKTEPILIALAGLILLGDNPTLLGWTAIIVATAGVVLTALKPSAAAASGGWKPVALGVAAAGAFALSAVSFRGAIMGLETGVFVIRATTTLAWSLGMQTALLLVWLALFDRKALVGSFTAWRQSIPAGFLGAFASQFWFIGFSLTSAANVRTLALVEVFMAMFVSRRIFDQSISRREVVGMGLIVFGVALLLWSHA